MNKLIDIFLIVGALLCLVTAAAFLVLTFTATVVYATTALEGLVGAALCLAVRKIFLYVAAKEQAEEDARLYQPED